MQTQIALLVWLSSLCIFILPASTVRFGVNGRASKRIRSSHVLHERHEPGHVNGWVKREAADPEWKLPVRIGLRQSNVEAGHELLMDM